MRVNTVDAPDSPTSSVYCRSADCEFYPCIQTLRFRSSAPGGHRVTTTNPRLLKFKRPKAVLRLDNKPLPLDDYSSSAPLRDLLSLLEQYDMPSVRLIEFIARHRVNLLRTLLEKGGD